jgi:hypothetical protein
LEIMARPGDEKAYLTNQYGSGSSQVTAAGRYSDDFHTYTIEWAPSAFRILVDGVPRMTDSHASLKRKWIGFAMSRRPLPGADVGSRRGRRRGRCHDRRVRAAARPPSPAPPPTALEPSSCPPVANGPIAG